MWSALIAEADVIAGSGHARSREDLLALSATAHCTSTVEQRQGLAQEFPTLAEQHEMKLEEEEFEWDMVGW